MQQRIECLETYQVLAAGANQIAGFHADRCEHVLLARRRRGRGRSRLGRSGIRGRGSGSGRGRGSSGSGKRGIVDEGNVRAPNRIILETLDTAVLVENRTLRKHSDKKATAMGSDEKREKIRTPGRI